MIEQAGDSVTFAGKPIIAATYRCVLAGIARRRRDGLPSTDLQELARALRRAHDAAMSLERHEIGASTPALSGLNGQDPSDLISVADAADILRLSKRQVQRLAASPGGLGAVRAGRTWMLAKAPVLALAKERARDRTNCLPPELGSARSTPA